MLGNFLKRFFSIPTTQPPIKPVSTPAPVYKATTIELTYVKQTLAKFEELGLHPNQNFDVSLETYANAVIEGYPENEALNKENDFNRIKHYAPFPELTVLSCTSEDFDQYPHYFSNVLLFADHCFDGESCENHFELVKRILEIAQADWQVEVLSVENPRFTVTIKDNLKQSVLTITDNKNFDLEFFQQLNSVLPADISHRFGYAGDGGHILVVWLPEDAFPAFNAYCGIEFDT